MPMPLLSGPIARQSSCGSMSFWNHLASRHSFLWILRRPPTGLPRHISKSLCLLSWYRSSAVILMPVSSRVSLMAVSRRLSPLSCFPPGRLHRPLCLGSVRWIRRISFLSFTTRPNPGMARLRHEQVSPLIRRDTLSDLVHCKRGHVQRRCLSWQRQGWIPA